MSANKIRHALAVLSGSAALIFGIEANATVMQPATFDEKVANAASIVLGRCVNTESRWDESRRWIVTYSTFSVEKSIKGGSQGNVTVITPGGSVGDVHQDTIGVPQFAPGDERVLFVKSTPAGNTVLYFDQGTYDVVNEGGQRVVRPVTTEAVTLAKSGASIAPEPARTIDQFEQAVRESERRVRDRIEMEMVKERDAREQSITAILLRNRGLVALALAGLALATWQFLRRGH